MKKSVKIIIVTILVLALGCGIFYYYWNNRLIYNNENAIGNTTGNLQNGGLFCEYNDKIYFANPADNNKLYVMNSDCTHAKKLNDDSVASINVCGNNIYYVRNNFSKERIGMVFRGQLYGVYRTNLNGTGYKALYDKQSGIIALKGNTIFYQHYDNKTAFSIWKVGIDGKDNVKISDTTFDPSCIRDNRIYYASIDGKHGISYYDIDMNKSINYHEANAYLVDVEGNYAYYIDVSKGYSLVRLNMSNKTLELLYGVDGSKVINYNIYGNKVFLQVESEDGLTTGLYRMNVDGTQLEYIAAGNITNIHCTSQYTFFQFVESQGTLYRVSTTQVHPTVEEITVK